MSARQTGSGVPTHRHRPDNGPIHTSQATRAALAARKPWLARGWLAKYAPELNDIERDWKTLKADHLAHKTFRSRASLKATIDADIQAMNSSRKSQPLANQRISA
jgi:transposase